MTTTQCAKWDFTLPDTGQELKLLKDNLRTKCKQWAFQLELGRETNYKHYQGRFSLRSKKRLSALKSLFSEPEWAQVHFSPTANANTGNINYVIKDDTKLDGPWTDKDEEIYIPRQVRELGELRPFQQHIIDHYDDWDTRTINIIYCEHGNVGKTSLVQYMRAYKIGRALPPVNDYKDLLRIVCDLPISRCYLFDMPRSLNKDRLYQFFSAVETIKDGYAYDDRYSFKETVFDCPNIWIFTNTLPDLTMLSSDRWRIWTIDPDDYGLKTYILLD